MRKLRLLLFPIAGVYYLVTLVRNKLFDTHVLKSKKYELPIICVGNLSVGGTGKTPMTEFVLNLLHDNYRVATLSRGYGRSTKGYLDVRADDSAIRVGDEPLQFAQKFKDVQVAVCEDRQTGIETLMSKTKAPQVIVLDDAYQHRKVVAGFYVLLTPYGDLYSNDFVLPAGNLREPRHGSARADVVIVSKCPEDITLVEQQEIEVALKLKSNQSIYFSKIVYDEQVYFEKGFAQLNSLKVKEVTLVTGIANPKPLTAHLNRQGLTFSHKSYGDHHNFTVKEIEELEQLECILTTEKDYVRLRPLLKMKQLFYLPIKIGFVNGTKQSLTTKVEEFVSTF